MVATLPWWLKSWCGTRASGRGEAKDPATLCLFPDTRSQAWGCPPPEPPQSRERAGSRAAPDPGPAGWGGEENAAAFKGNVPLLRPPALPQEFGRRGAPT